MVSVKGPYHFMSWLFYYLYSYVSNDTFLWYIKLAKSFQSNNTFKNHSFSALHRVILVFTFFSPLKTTFTQAKRRLNCQADCVKQLVVHFYEYLILTSFDHAFIAFDTAVCYNQGFESIPFAVPCAFGLGCMNLP